MPSVCLSTRSFGNDTRQPGETTDRRRGLPRLPKKGPDAMAKRIPDVQDLTPILGSTFIKQLTTAPVLAIGSDSWSLHGLVNDLGVGNVKAARILSSIARSEKYRNTEDLFKRSSPYSFADTHAGVTTLYVLFAAFEAKGLDPEEWYQLGEDRARVMFQTYKIRERQARKRTRAARPKKGELVS
jgi:hypothetical protein